MTIQRQLSSHEELVHALDPDPVFDYLVQHGVLEQSVVDTICGEEKLVDRNIKLLQHVEDTGNPAVELFLNALRQSGQLHLASLLDVEHRIKPVYGEGYWEKQRYKGYWEKQRYKGQVTITFQLVAAKVRVRKDSDEDKSPKIEDINAMLTPFKVKHSYENVTSAIDDQPRAQKTLQYNDDTEDEHCCCCCFIFCCSSKSRKKQKKLNQKVEITISRTQNGADVAGSPVTKPPVSLDFCDIMVSLPSQPASPLKSGSTFFKSRPWSVTKCEPVESQTPSPMSDSNDQTCNQQWAEMGYTAGCRLSKSVGDLLDTEVTFDTKTDKACVTLPKPSKQEKGKKNKKSGKNKMNKMKKQKNGKSVGDKIENGGVEYQTTDIDNKENKENKENSDPCIYSLMDDDVSESPSGRPQTELRTPSCKTSPPKSLNTKKTRAMKRSETYELVERWKSEGAQYQSTRDQFFSFFDNVIESSIVRYFEQDRKTLVLSVGTKESMSICTLCMTIKEVRKLREDYELGALHEDLVRCIVPQNIIDRMECCAIHLRTVINEDDFILSYQELS